MNKILTAGFTPRNKQINEDNKYEILEESG